MRSLFIVSLPRSLSSFTFQVCRIVLGLEEPVWTSDGEILNLDRFAFAQAEGAGWKFTPGGASDSCFERMKRFLDQAVAPEGFIYKDVVQPFLVSDWLRRKDLAVLRIERDLAEVACSMLARQWFYPERAAELPGRREERVIEGLVRASAALDALEGVPVIRYEELVSDEQALWRKLSELYPDCAVPKFTYIDDRFRQAREAAMARRETNRFREIAEAFPWLRVPRKGGSAASLAFERPEGGEAPFSRGERSSHGSSNSAKGQNVSFPPLRGSRRKGEISFAVE